MAKKISELPETTTPPSTVEIAVVDAGTTKRSTADALLNSRSGWFETHHGAGAQTGVGTTITQVLFDNATNEYDHLPNGISESDVYTNVGSKFYTDWLNEGQALLLKVSGIVTTDKVNTGVDIHFIFYDTDGVQIEDQVRQIAFHRDTGAIPFSVAEPTHIRAEEAAAGSYMKVWIKFDDATGTGNIINADEASIYVIH